MSFFLNHGRCCSCDKEGAKSVCSRCKLVKYCDATCQSSHWKRHKTSTCVTSLCVASEFGMLDVFQALLNRGASVNELHDDNMCALFLASQNNHSEIVAKLLEGGALVDVTRRSDGASPCYMATQNGHTAVAKQLLAAGANALLPALDGATPFRSACHNNRLDIVGAMLATNPNLDVNHPGQDGATGLLLSAQEGHMEVVSLSCLAGEPTRAARGISTD